MENGFLNLLMIINTLTEFILMKETNTGLNDDYVKFIKVWTIFGRKNGEGIVAFINPHGYLDNPTFRGMRWNLLKTFDKIYTIDLTKQ